jgi:ribosomal protein S18 acetylase RimI-like enzyme
MGSMVKITLRPIAPEDREFLLRVYASTREEELAPVPWTPEQKDAFLRMQFEAQHAYYQENYRGADWLVIEDGGVPIGRLYVHRRPGEIRLVDITLLTAHRGNGAGSFLLRELMAEATTAGKPLRIHVEKHNPARSLYQRLGFVPIEDRGVYDFLEWAPPGGGKELS